MAQSWHITVTLGLQAKHLNWLHMKRTNSSWAHVESTALVLPFVSGSTKDWELAHLYIQEFVHASFAAVQLLCGTHTHSLTFRMELPSLVCVRPAQTIKASTCRHFGMPLWETFFSQKLWSTTSLEILLSWDREAWISLVLSRTQ